MRLQPALQKRALMSLCWKPDSIAGEKTLIWMREKLFKIFTRKVD